MDFLLVIKITLYFYYCHTNFKKYLFYFSHLLLLLVYHDPNGSESVAITVMAGSCHRIKKTARFNFNSSDLDDRGWGFIFYFVGPTCH
jgi:hypothetical protein